MDRVHIYGGQKKLQTDSQTALEGYHARAGETIAADFEFTIPNNIPASTQPKSREKTNISWNIHLKTKLKGAPPYPDVTRINVIEQVSNNNRPLNYERSNDGQVIDLECVDE